MNKFLKNFIFATITMVVVFLVANSEVYAGEFVDVEYPVGTNLNSDKIFNADNIYPGWSASKVLRVRNKNQTDKVNVYFTFDAVGDKKLAKKLKLYVIRKKDDSYRIGGEGDRWTLKTADEDSLYVDRLDPGESTQYEVKIKFDKDAGNEYQGLKAKFDIKFGLESQVANNNLTEAENERQILENQGRETFTGEAPKEEGVKGENEEGNGGQVSGEETTCHSWPLWVWIVLAGIFAGLSLFSTQKTKKEKAKKHFSWQLGGVLGAILIWYLFDKCLYFKWFPVTVIIIGILNHLYYQKFKMTDTSIEK